MPPRDLVFVSYSHKDTTWLERLQQALGPDARNRRIGYFDDQNIAAGDLWHRTLTEAIDRARVAVLLVSPNFFASDFITKEELPRILTAAEAGELTILWVPLFGAFDARELNKYQSIGDPAQPLETIPEESRTAHLLRLARGIVSTLNPGRIPNNLPFASLGDLFVGRERELAELNRSLTRDGAAAITQAHTVSGLGGIGKTRLAMEYAWRHRDRFQAFLFARAGTPQELKSGLASLCRPDALDLAAHIADKEDDQYAAVVRWLQENRDWLLILDNVDSPDAVRAVEELVAKLVAKLPGGQILITSRITQWSRSIAQSKVDVLDPAAARELLLRRSGAQDAVADELAEKLGRLPLALEIAAAYVSQQPAGFGLAGYLRLYLGAEWRMLNEPAVEGYPMPVYLTWQASVERLTPAARRMLELHSFMAPAPCPVALYIQAANEAEVRASLADLFRYSLAERGAADTFTVHSLLQAVERHELKARGEDVASLEPVQSFLIAYGGTPSWEPASRALWDLLLPHADALRTHAAVREIDSRTEILWRVGEAYRERGDYRNAIPTYRACLGVEERVLGPEDPDTLTSVNNLAYLLQSQGDYAAAEPLYRRALEVRTRVLGPEHPETLKSVSNLAELLRNQGDYGAAGPLYHRALEVRERVLGPEHTNTLKSVNNLAELLRNQGDYAAAETLHRRALEAYERVLGPQHPDTLRSVNNLAELLRIQGDYGAAEPLIRRALEARERVLGPEHPNTLASVNNLAALLESKGDSVAAGTLYCRALDAFERVLGSEHPDTLTTVNNLAGSLESQGGYAAAERLYRRALQARERVLGPEHPDTLSSVNNLAFLLQSQGNYAAAEPLYCRAFEGARKVLGSDHPTTKAIENNLTRCRAAMNNS